MKPTFKHARKIKASLICLLLSTLFFLGSCKKKDKSPEPEPTPTPTPVVPTPTVPTTPTTTPTNTLLPTLTTITATVLTDSTAKCGGNVTSEGAAVISAVGVCWDEQPSPTLLKSKTSDGAGTGSYSSSLTGLKPNTTYYVRAYASNMHGTAYGNEVSFTTPKTPKWILWDNGLPFFGPGNQVYKFVTVGSNIFATTSQGVFKSNGGANNWTACNTGLTDLNVLSMVTKGSGLFIAGWAGVFYSGDNGANWTAKNNGILNGSASDIAVSGNNLFVSDGLDIYRSTDDGANWTSVTPPVLVNADQIAVVGTSVYFVDQISNTIYVSTDNGSNWTAMPAISGNPFVTDMMGVGSSLYVSADKIYTTSNNGANWSTLDSGLPANEQVSGFAYNSGNNTFYLEADNYMYSSSNNGNTWAKMISHPLPNGSFPNTIGFYQSDIFVSVPRIVKLDK
jgi:photosystem II stability/assembly factor-like uncharacterized protein